MNQELMTLDFWQDTIIYEDKALPIGTLACDALNVSADTLAKMNEQCQKINLLLGMLNAGQDASALFPMAREAALTMLEILSKTPPFSYMDISCDCFPGSCQHHRGCSVPDESAENRAQIPDSDPPGSYLRNPLPVCWKANYLVYGTSCIGCSCQQSVWSQGVIYRDTLVPNPWDSG